MLHTLPTREQRMAGIPMGMDDTPWQPGDDDDSADPYREWVFSDAHDIEYWAIREGRLVPAERGDLERIAEWERERDALPRLRQWEREKQSVRSPGVVVRVAAWCVRLGRQATRAYRTQPKATEHIQTSTSASHGVPRRRSDVAPR